MLQNLARCLRTRRTTAGLTFGPPLASTRLYTIGRNEDIIKMLNECAEKEDSSPTKNMFKVRSFKVAAAAIEKLDFRVQHGDELKKVQGVGLGTRKRINQFLGCEVEYPMVIHTSIRSEKLLKKMTLKELTSVPGIGVLLAEAIYDAGCDTVAKLRLEEYHQMLGPKGKIGLKYFEYLGAPTPREDAETIVEFCKQFTSMDECEIIIAGDYRRGLSDSSKPIELLLVDKSATASAQIPPHPSTLKPSDLEKPMRKTRPRAREDKRNSVLLNRVVKPLEELGVVSDATIPGANVWQGWVRVPKKGESWESRKERIEGIQNMDGNFRLVNVTYVPERSLGAALLFLTGDEEYFFACARKAAKSGLYLNARGLWEWEPDAQSLSRFKTSDEPYEKSSLGAIWGSESEADKGRWLQLETIEEKQVFDAIGEEYVQPDRRNFSFLVKGGKPKPKKGLEAA